MTMIRSTNTTCVKPSASLEIWHKVLISWKSPKNPKKRQNLWTTHRYIILCVTPALINNLKHKEAFCATGKDICSDTCPQRLLKIDCFFVLLSHDFKWSQGLHMNVFHFLERMKWLRLEIQIQLVWNLWLL